MSPIALYFASGESLYAGAVLMAVGVVGPFLKHPWVSRLTRIAFWLGLAMIVMASPPVSWLAIAGFSLLLAAWLISLAVGPRAPAVLRRSASLAILVALAWLLVSERSWRRLPKISGAMDDHLVVIGDSISSGLEAQSPAWPLAMQRSFGVKVKNLARAGAQVADGKSMAGEVKPEDHVVLIELGGNDLLSGTPPQQFSDGLNATLAPLVHPGRVLVMLELPLLPHRIAYGQIQRQLAMQYSVYLIPKKYFAEAISGSDATTDGLHLSIIGSRRMAILIARALSTILKTRSPPPAS